jgi:acetyl-CoA carboxylase carboxyl transferase subunit beta
MSMGLFSRRKPKIKVQSTRKDSFSGWLKCTHCAELIHRKELEQNLNCCPKCDFHYRQSVTQRLALLADEGSVQELFTELQTSDPLSFTDSQAYPERVAKARQSSGREEGVWVGQVTMQGRAVALGIMDFNFMAGSMGSVVGEKLTLLIEWALAQRLPLIIVSASGGARMQESFLSLMQMAKTSAALARLGEARLPYISVLTNPTTGGVTASFASLGDIIVAEPKALICFAGPRVVEQTIGEKLPPEAQKAEYLLEHGMIDSIVPRVQMRQTLCDMLAFLSDNPAPLREGRKTLAQTEIDEKKDRTALQRLFSLSGA